MMKQLNEDAAFREVVMEEVRRIIVDMLRFPLPVVAAVNGPAVGLGCSLALAADHVLLSDKAKLGDPHLNVGLVPGDGGVVLWPFYTSLLKVKEYLFTGKLIAANDAVDMGLANRVVPHDELMNEAMAFAELLASKPRKALQDTKRALNSYIETQSRGPMEIAIQAEYKSMASPEHTKAGASICLYFFGSIVPNCIMVENILHNDAPTRNKGSSSSIRRSACSCCFGSLKFQ